MKVKSNLCYCNANPKTDFQRSHHVKSALFSSDFSAVCVFQSISLSSHSTRNPTNRPPTVHNTFHSCSPPPLLTSCMCVCSGSYTPNGCWTHHKFEKPFTQKARIATPHQYTQPKAATASATPIHTYKFALLRRVCCFSSSLHTLGNI